LALHASLSMKRKREESVSDDLPELDLGAVENFFQGVEYTKPYPNFLDLLSAPQLAHNMAAINTNFSSAAAFQPMQAIQKYIRSGGALKGFPNQGNMYELTTCCLEDIGSVYGEQVEPMNLINSSEFHESFESSSFTGLSSF
jgi:hypothetical protein